MKPAALVCALGVVMVGLIAAVVWVKDTPEHAILLVGVAICAAAFSAASALMWLLDDGE